ncbi:MAG: hypothetical protein EPN93_12760 [Spirochaetes bacterium]|nr:MAG: hypothetical protein EPN93_12760 [Spirochaetota bacterium]
MFRITPFEPRLGTVGGALAMLCFPGTEPVPLLRGLLPPESAMEVRFGMGYARFAYEVRGTRVGITHWLPDDNSPAVVTDMRITPGPQAPERLMLAHGVAAWFIDFDPVCSGWRRERFGRAPVLRLLSLVSRYLLYPLRLNTNWRRMRFARSFTYRVESATAGEIHVFPERRAGKRFDPRALSPRQEFPQTFFSGDAGRGEQTCAVRAVPFSSAREVLGALARGNGFSGTKEYRNPVNLAHSFALAPRNTQDFRVVWGYADRAEVETAARALYHASMENHMAARRKDAFFFSVPGIPWVEREWTWHAGQLRDAAMYDRCHDSHTVRQGGAYYFVQGVDGAPRDHALFAAALSYIDPPLAREILVTMLRATHADGTLPYALYGYGMSSGFGLHGVSGDLHLFFLWALTEYVFATRDFAFLDEIHPYHPAGTVSPRTVKSAVAQYCRYVMERTGTGAHGLLRSGTGDWNDFIQFHAKRRRAYIRDGESTYTTAMALYVLPHTAALAASWDDALAGKLYRFTERLRAALLRQWNGRQLIRSWDGRGNAIGGDALFMEHHAWALASGALPGAMADTIADAIRETLDAPSPCGAHILAPPARLRFDFLPSGWDTNGGVWPAANAILTWGYGARRPAYARASLFKNTLCAHAEAYPDIWFGTWSGPDSYNARYAENAGETFYHITPMADFPVMNANVHASPILAALRTCGVEPDAFGFRITPRLPDPEWSLKCALLEIEKREGSLSFLYRAPSAAQSGTLTFTVEDPLCAAPAMSIVADGREISFERTGDACVRFVLPCAPGVSLKVRVTRNKN